MIALEALREATIDLEYQIDSLFDCIEGNSWDIDDNSHGVHHNYDFIGIVGDDVHHQQDRVKVL